jgi:hypothetical protein
MRISTLLSGYFSFSKTVLSGSHMAFRDHRLTLSGIRLTPIRHRAFDPIFDPTGHRTSAAQRHAPSPQLMGLLIDLMARAISRKLGPRKLAPIMLNAFSPESH